MFLFVCLVKLLECLNSSSRYMLLQLDTKWALWIWHCDPKTLLMTILNNVYDMGKTDTSQYLIFVHSTSKSLIVSLHALNKTLDVFAELVRDFCPQTEMGHLLKSSRWIWHIIYPMAKTHTGCSGQVSLQSGAHFLFGLVVALSHSWVMENVLSGWK